MGGWVRVEEEASGRGRESGAGAGMAEQAYLFERRRWDRVPRPEHAPPDQSGQQEPAGEGGEIAEEVAAPRRPPEPKMKRQSSTQFSALAATVAHKSSRVLQAPESPDADKLSQSGVHREYSAVEVSHGVAHNLWRAGENVLQEPTRASEL